MEVVFRVDASTEMGSGHVMRCLVLAEALRKRQAQVTFACLPLEGNLIELIQSKGFQVVTLPALDAQAAHQGDSEYSKWLPHSQKQDAAFFLSEFSRFTTDWVVVDHYSLGCGWEGYIKEALGCKILSVDDLNRKHDSDLILDQNLWRDMESRYSTSSARVLLGPEYALLRDSFSEYRNAGFKKKDQVIAFFGGSDISAECKKLVEGFNKVKSLPFSVVVIAGRLNECYKQIDEINLNPKVSVIRFAEDFDRMLAESRYVIGASGVSNWERFCLKVPASIVSVAENQRELSRYIAELGFVHFLGESEQTSSQTYVKEAHRLVSNWDSLVPFDDLDVDGYGACRVVEELLDNC